jgi:hypothetical protein
MSTIDAFLPHTVSHIDNEFGGEKNNNAFPNKINFPYRCVLDKNEQFMNPCSEEMNGEECYHEEESGYDKSSEEELKYKKSSEEESGYDNTSEEESNKMYRDIGGYNDRPERALDQGPMKYGYTPEQCSAWARQNGFTYFALQDGNGKTGWCSTSNDLKKATQYGKTNTGKTGGQWQNYIYENIDMKQDQNRKEKIMYEDLGLVDFPGNDIKYENEIPYNQCEDECNKIENCMGYVENVPNGKGCWFKNKFENKRGNNARRSFKKRGESCNEKLIKSEMKVNELQKKSMKEMNELQQIMKTQQIEKETQQSDKKNLLKFMEDDNNTMDANVIMEQFQVNNANELINQNKKLMDKQEVQKDNIKKIQEKEKNLEKSEALYQSSADRNDFKVKIIYSLVAFIFLFFILSIALYVYYVRDFHPSQ